MQEGDRKLYVRIFDVIAPLAFLAAAVAMFLPMVRIQTGGAVTLFSGCDLLFKGADAVPASGRTVVDALLHTWYPSAIGVIFAATAGLLSVLARCFGSAKAKLIFEKVEIFAGIFGAIFVAKLVGDAAGCDLRKAGDLTYLHGMVAAFVAFALALVSALTVFVVEFPSGSEFKVGTLTYNNRSLMKVFFWVLWGNFFYAFMQGQILFNVLPLQFKNIGFSPVALILLATTLPSIVYMVVTPIISYKSDRTRTRWGRRLPYLALTTPFVGLFFVLIGYAGPIKEAVEHWSFFAEPRNILGIQITAMTAAMACIAFITVGFAFFNDFISGIYYSLVADVVPRETIGRFQAISNMVGSLSGLIFNAFVFQYAESHTKEIYLWSGMLFTIGYALMCWNVKEGEYPPVDDVPQTTSRWKSIFLQTGNYFRECFSKPLYLSFFLFTTLWTISNACLAFKMFFLLDAGISLTQVADVFMWSGIIGLTLTYPMGAAIDKFKPLPTLIAATILYIPLTFAGYYINNFFIFALISFGQIPIGVLWELVMFPAQVQIMPRSKFAQFSSANGFVRSAVRMIAPLIGAWFIASMAVEKVTINPGETMRISCEGAVWKNATVAVNDRTPLQVLTDELAATTNATAASTNLISTATLSENYTMKKENKKFYVMNPKGKTCAMVLPGVENKKWFFIANTDKDKGGKIVIKVGKWGYVFVWQGIFMTLGLFSIFIVLHYWRKEEKLRAAGLGAE